MKKIKRASIVASSLLMATLSGVSVFADDGNFGIIYSGGADLGSSNVTINENLVSGLTTLIKSNNATSTPNGSAKWKKGYAKTSGNDSPCRPFYYFEVPASTGATITSAANEELGFTITGDKYVADVTIKDVEYENLEVDRTYAVGIFSHLSSIYGGWDVYEDAECTDAIISKTLLRDNDDSIFVDAVIDLHNKGESANLISDQLYFGITDIDYAQSYKIMNVGNELAPSNMFAKNADHLQQEGATLKNKYVASGNYIYSEYDGSTGDTVVSDNKANVFVKLAEATQREGLDIVYGFGARAGSGIEFFAKQYVVTYETDDLKHGTITGTITEDVMAGENPSSTEREPKEGFVETKWTADVPVVLKNGNRIEANTPMTEAQAKQVVVNQDITFTIYFERQYKVTYVSDKNGDITGITAENVISGENPSGTEQEPKEGYVDQKWVADVDVTLEDGTTIKAGEPITAAQIKQVVVDKDIEFKVYHVTEEAAAPATPNTGATTKGADIAKIAALPVIALLGIALAIRALPRFTHKKVNFDK